MMHPAAVLLYPLPAKPDVEQQETRRHLQFSLFPLPSFCSSLNLENENTFVSHYVVTKIAHGKPMPPSSSNNIIKTGIVVALLHGL
jgi:hypothetical protein